MKRKILNYLKVFCLFFFMIMGIFFILAELLYQAGMPLEDEWLLLVLFASCLIEYGYYLWVKE
jgi:hypothetical protein